MSEQVVIEVFETCREVLPEGARCPERAEFLLWGALFEKHEVGPRCRGHAVDHTHQSMPYSVGQWAVLDMRNLAHVTTEGAGA